MSDDPILHAIARLEAMQEAMRNDIRDVRIDIGDVRTHIGDVRNDIQEVRADVRDVRADFLAELGARTATITGKVADLQGEVAAIRDDIAVDMGALDQVERINENTRADVRQMREQMTIMWKQLKAAQADIRELRGES
jgi:chromosome segregation ATPase